MYNDCIVEKVRFIKCILEKNWKYFTCGIRKRDYVSLWSGGTEAVFVHLTKI